MGFALRANRAPPGLHLARGTAPPPPGPLVSPTARPLKKRKEEDRRLDRAPLRVLIHSVFDGSRKKSWLLSAGEEEGEGTGDSERCEAAPRASRQRGAGGLPPVIRTGGPVAPPGCNSPHRKRPHRGAASFLMACLLPFYLPPWRSIPPGRFLHVFSGSRRRRKRPGDPASLKGWKG